MATLAGTISDTTPIPYGPQPHHVGFSFVLPSSAPWLDAPSKEVRVDTDNTAFLLVLEPSMSTGIESMNTSKEKQNNDTDDHDVPPEDKEDDKKKLIMILNQSPETVDSENDDADKSPPNPPPLPCFQIIQPWFVVLGDTHARADRTTEATILLRRIKAEFKERFKNKKRTWIPAAIQAFDEALRLQFPPELYPDIAQQDMGCVLFKCTEKAKDRHILEPNVFGYPKDKMPTYGKAETKESIIHFFKSRDSPTLELELARYRREFDVLAASTEQPPEERMVDFGETLAFFERKLGRAQQEMDLATKLLDDLKPINALKEQWKALVAAKHVRTVSIGEEASGETSGRGLHAETSEDDPAGLTAAATITATTTATATTGTSGSNELHPLMENMSELGDSVSLGEPSVEMMQLLEFFCAEPPTLLDRGASENNNDHDQTGAPEKDTWAGGIVECTRNVRQKRCRPDDMETLSLPFATESYGDDDTMQQGVSPTHGIVGMQSSLRVPDHWDVIRDPNIVQLHHLNVAEREYSSVCRAFLSTLPKSAKVIRISRVQNLHMWQSYVVKRQNICHREMYVAGGTMSVAVAEKMWKLAMSRFERRWLWHGTSSVDTGKILQQGFNRSFCGKNATSYGKGVYFARDAKYSAYKSYAVPDNQGHQFVMACRVMVGEYCLAQKDDKAPAVRNVETNQLYDSTVNDTGNPSIHVIYHDAQAYPEYLIEFKK